MYLLQGTLLPARSLLASGVGGFKVSVYKGLLATSHIMGKKARILSLPRDCHVGGGMFFARFLMLSFQCWRVSVAELKWNQGLIYLVLYRQMSESWLNREVFCTIADSAPYCRTSAQHQAWAEHASICLEMTMKIPSEMAVACMHHSCERRMTCLDGICPAVGSEPKVTDWSRPQGHNLLLMMTSLLWMTRTTMAFSLSFSVTVTRQ